MSRGPLLRGTTSHLLPLRADDASSTIGAGLTGLLYNTASLVAEYWREGDTTWTTITLVSGTLGTWVSGGFKEDSYGHYELGLPNLALSQGKWVKVRLRGATNLVPVEILLPLWSFNPQDAVRGGLTALPNAAAGANGGLPLGDASGRVDLGKWLGNIPDALSSGKVPADLKLWLTVAPAALSTNGYVQAMLLRWLTDNAGGTPSALSSGNLPADLKLWLATAPLPLSAQQVQAIVSAYGSGLAPLQPTTAGRTLDVSVTGEAGLDFDNVKQATGATTLANITVPLVSTLFGHTPQTGDNFARIGVNGAGLTAVALSAAGIKAVWDQLLSATFAVGSLGEKFKSWLATLGSDNRVKVSVDAHASGETAAGITDKAGFGLAASERVKLAAAQPDYAPLLAGSYSAPDNIGIGVAAAQATGANAKAALIQAVTDKLNTALEQDGAVYRYTANALEQAPAGGGGGGGEVIVTLSQVAVAMENVVANSGTLTIRQGDLFSVQLTGLGAIAPGDKVYFTMRRPTALTTDDADALLQIERTAGLLVLNGAPAVTPTRGALVVNDAVAGDVTITLQPAATKLLPLVPRTGEAVYDVKVVRTPETNAATLTEAPVKITGAVTRATS